MFRILSLFIVLGFYPLVILGAVNSAELSAEIAEIKETAELTAERKDSALSLLNKAQQLLDKKDSRSQAIKAFGTTAASAQATLDELNTELETLRAKTAIGVPDTASTEYVESQLSALQVERATQEAALKALLAQEGKLVVRANEIADDLATARSDISTLEAKPVAENDSDGVARAAYLFYEAQLEERTTAIEYLLAERTTLPTRQELVAARIALANARLAQLDETIEPLQQRLGQSRVRQARAKLLEVEQVLNEPLATQGLHRLATENNNLAKRQLALVEQFSSLSGNSLGLQQDLTKVTAASQTVEQVLATGQLNDDTADLLRTVGNRLPNLQHLKEQIERGNESIISLRLNRILWQDRLRNLADVEVAARRFLNEYGEPEPALNVVSQASAILVQRQDLLQALVNSARDTSELQSEQRKLYEDLLTRTTAQRNVLQRHLLWLPTKTESGQKLLKNLSDNVYWLTSPEGWYETGQAVLKGYRSFSPVALLLVFVALFLRVLAPAFRRKLQIHAQFVGNVKRDTYTSTPLAMLTSFGLAIPLPLLIGSLGLAIALGSEAVFSTAISRGLFAAAALLFILNGFRTLARPRGVFELHFRWSKTACELLRFHLRWFTAVEVLVSFAFASAFASDDLVIKYGIGRLAFIIGAIAIAVFAYHFLKSRDGIAATVRDGKRSSGMQKFLFFVFLLAPLVVGIMPLFGYYEAAIVLQEKIFLSGVTLLLTGIIYSLCIRFFLIGHRRLAFKRVTEMRQRKKEARQSGIDIEQSGDATPRHSEDELVDLDTLSRESVRTLKVTILVVLLLVLTTIWSSLLPAFGIVDEVVLWQGTRYVNDVAVVTDISLWNVLVAVSLLVGGFVIANNVRGILELAVFERLHFDPGTRYAVITITGYLLVGVGTVAGLGQLGVNWSSMQWIIAALGVGLGFGLQEIVANFVSGLIILFERPIRVGDIVTVGQLEGTVTSIKIRATRITDFDNREVLMPNKSIITENVTNWTLTDQITRIKIQIGVAYGSDVDEVRDIILKTVVSHPETLNDPAPAVFFLSHGDSSLNFEARVFVGSTAMRLPITHDLNRGINVALSENGIEIPFPQRDLHLKTAIEPIAIKTTDDE